MGGLGCRGYSVYRVTTAATAITGSGIETVEFITKRWKQLREFLSETRAEMKKVTFPPRDQVVTTTIVVVITSLIFAFFLWVADLVILKVYGWIYQVLGA